MKMIKGLFDGITESLAPGIGSPDKVVRDHVIYSCLVEGRDKDEDSIMEKGVQKGLDMADKVMKEKKKNITDAVDKKMDDFFSEPSFAKGAMDVDPGGAFTKMKDADMDVDSLSGKKQDEDLFDMGKLI